MECTCGNSDGDWNGNYWELIRVKSKRRKAFCVECHTPILPGEKYLSMNWLGPDGGGHEKRCMTCHNMAVGMNHYGRIGGLYEDIADCLGMPEKMVWTEDEKAFEAAREEVEDLEEIDNEGFCSKDCPMYVKKKWIGRSLSVGDCLIDRQDIFCRRPRKDSIVMPGCPYQKKWENKNNEK